MRVRHSVYPFTTLTLVEPHEGHLGDLACKNPASAFPKASTLQAFGRQPNLE